MTVRKGVVAIVFQQEQEIKFLVLHRTLGWKGWEFPKGGVERIDKGLDELAVKRELMEETGMQNVRVLMKVPFEIRYSYPLKYADKYRHSETVQSVYLIRAFEDEVVLSMEHDDYTWLNYDDAMETLTYDDQKKALSVAWEHLQKMKKE